MKGSEDRYRQEVPKRYKKTSPQKPGPDGSTLITVVIIVSLLLLIIWFVTNQFIRVMGGSSYDNQPAIESSEEEGASTSTSREEVSRSETIDTSDYDMQEEGKSSDQAEEKPAPLTEGPADYAEPKTWVGKTFPVNARSNVRSGPGTGSGIINTANPGNTITVREAKMEADSVWCYGQIKRDNGETFEGWIYGWSLDAKPVEE